MRVRVIAQGRDDTVYLSLGDTMQVIGSHGEFVLIQRQSDGIIVTMPDAVEDIWELSDVPDTSNLVIVGPINELYNSVYLANWLHSNIDQKLK